MRYAHVLMLGLILSAGALAPLSAQPAGSSSAEETVRPAQKDNQEAARKAQARRKALRKKQGQRAAAEATQDKRRADSRQRWDSHRRRARRFFGTLFIAGAIVHLLLTVIVFNDMKARNAMNGLWIVVVLLSGTLGAMVYAVMSVGERIEGAMKGRG